MKTSPLVALGLVPFALQPTDLRTTYAADTSSRVVRTSSYTSETTGVEIERDGEPVDAGGRMGGGGERTSKRVVCIDHVLEAPDGEATSVRRVFEALEGETNRFDEDFELDSPFAGLVVVLTRDSDGEIGVDVEEGDVEDEALELLRPELALDALLPGGDQTEWDVEGDALVRALGFDLDEHLWTQPDYAEAFGGERRGGGRRRGSRSLATYFVAADWSASAESSEGLEEVDGVECRIVRIEADGSGSIEAGEGRMQSETEFEIEVEATLAFSVELGRPVRLDVEATLETESVSEFERGEVSMRITRSTTGTLEQSVAVAAAAE